jgi:(R,R)-butanediol dehydrogenase / meso-butanediol dehydrogenase / diacetyl reductase
MLAGLVTAPRRFELVDMPEPAATPGMVVVHVARCGICGTDLHGFLGPAPYNPAICGHEWVGTVADVGRGVTTLAAGDRVVAAIAPACGSCTECLGGRTEYCIPAFLGMVGRDAMAPRHGGFAPRLAIAAARLVRVDAPISDDQAAIVEPTTVSFHAVERTPPRDGEVVVVQGCGPIGLLTLQCAKARGASHIVAIEPSPHRRELALAVGASEAMTPAEATERFATTGADLVFECAGVASTIQQAVDLVRRGGRVNLVGLASGTATISPHAWLTKEVSVVASLGYLHHEFALTIDLIADQAVRVEPLHDRTVSLEELPAAIERLADDPSSAVKILVDPTGAA